MGVGFHRVQGGSPTSVQYRAVLCCSWSQKQASLLTKEEEEEDKFGKLWPAKKTDHLCQSWQ